MKSKHLSDQMTEENICLGGPGYAEAPNKVTRQLQETGSDQIVVTHPSKILLPVVSGEITICLPPDLSATTFKFLCYYNNQFLRPLMSGSMGDTQNKTRLKRHRSSLGL
jgi:hypothetical protein